MQGAGTGISDGVEDAGCEGVEAASLKLVHTYGTHVAGCVPYERAELDDDQEHAQHGAARAVVLQNRHG